MDPQVHMFLTQLIQKQSDIFPIFVNEHVGVVTDHRPVMPTSEGIGLLGRKVMSSISTFMNVPCDFSPLHVNELQRTHHDMKNAS